MAARVYWGFARASAVGLGTEECALDVLWMCCPPMYSSAYAGSVFIRSMGHCRVCKGLTLPYESLY